MKRRDASDSCMQCHMPQSETDLPHFAFTHHRIQIPDSNPVARLEQVVGLVPMSDVSHLPEPDRQRCLGLAYVAMMSHAQSAEEAQLFQERAVELLEGVWDAGLRDADVAANLARLSWRRDAEKAAMYARAALDAQPQRAESRVTALFTLGSTLLETGQPHEARPWLEQLVESRRNSEDWFLLAKCRKSLGDDPAAYEAMRRAAELSPHVPQLEQMAAEFARQAGDIAASEKHLERARELSKVPVSGRPSR
jgi:tetratricopeptide (TPR) repeat protein